MNIIRKVPPELRATAAMHQRLSLSSADFKHARLIAERILKQKLHDKYHGPSGNLLRALNCSMVMAYTRPFCGGQARQSSGIPALPGRFLRLLSKEQLRVHRTAMHDRNKFMAHTDADAVSLETVIVSFPNGKETLINVSGDRLAPLTAKATKQLYLAADKLWETTQAVATEFEIDLRPYFRNVSSKNIGDIFAAA